MTGYALDHPLVGEYLTRLDAATAHLPPDERSDVRQGIREHLREALADARSNADVRNVLDVVGQPEDFIDPPAATVPTAPIPYAPAPPGTHSGRGALEVIAVILLLIGGIVVPVVGWIVGVVLLWMSKAWTTRQKLLGTFVVPGGLAASFFAIPFLALFPVTTCTSQGTVETPSGRSVVETCTGSTNDWLFALATIVAVVGPVLVAIYLLRTAGRADSAAGATAAG